MSPSIAKIPFIGEKTPAGHNDCSGFGLVYNNLSEKKCGRLPSPLDVGLTKVFDRVRMKGHATMGFFSRLMGGSDEQTTAASEFEILAPVSGELVHLEKTNDPAFSSRAVGDGVAVIPQEGTVCAPVSGTVAALFPTEHALGIMSDDSSAQVMLHIGIDTVKLEGKGFHALVAQGDHVDAGQPLVEVDFDAVRAAGFDPTVFVIVCERSENSTLREHASGPVAAKEPVIWLSE